MIILVSPFFGIPVTCEYFRNNQQRQAQSGASNKTLKKEQRVVPIVSDCLISLA